MRADELASRDPLATEEEEDRFVFLAAGTGGAILLGMLLVPFRELTDASNFAFLFLALTIFVAEFGGGRAAVATALSSALSLDFFLTQPYLRLTIADKHDVIAFAGLTVCGLIAAAAGARRRVRNATLVATRKQLALLRDGLRRMDDSSLLEPALASLLDSAVAGLPLAAAVVRDEYGQVLAVAGRVREMATPAPLLARESLVPEGTSRSLPPLPETGGRIALTAGGRPLGWFDVWGNGRPADAEARRTLVALCRLAAALLARASGARAIAGSGPS